MKAIPIVVCAALIGVVAYPQCVTVEEFKPQECSPAVRIAIELGGEPLPGVKVDLYPRYAKEAVFEGVTDEHGTVVPPKLAFGDYNVFASLNQAVVSFLQLRVVRDGPTTPLSISLGTLPAGGGENLPIREYFRVFQGSVQDPTRAAIPAAIVVVKRGGPERDVVLRSTADANGHFSEKLGDGSYIAFFFASGFRTATVPFEITAKGSDELQVKMRIGGCP